MRSRFWPGCTSRVADLDLVRKRSRELVHHDGVGPRGDGSAGHDQRRLAPAQRPGRGLSGEDRLTEPEPTGFPSRPEIGGPNGIAVHERLVEGRLIRVGDDVLGQPAAPARR